MSISLDFHLLGVRLGGLEIKVDEGTDKSVSTLSEMAIDTAVNKSIKWFSRKWTTRMTR